MNKNRKFGTLSILLLTISGGAVAQQLFIKDPEKLPEDQKKHYVATRELIDSWGGGVEVLEAADKLYHKFVQQTPNFLPIHIEKARIEIMRGYTTNGNIIAQNGVAKSILLDLIEKHPTYGKSYVLLGHVYTNLNELKNAENALQTAGNLDTQSDPWLYLNWSTLYKKKRQYALAYKQAEIALGLETDNVKAVTVALDTLIRLYPKSSAQHKDLDLHHIIFTSIPDDEKRLTLARRLLRAYQGRSEHLVVATVIVTEYLKKNPESEEGKLLLARLYITAGSDTTANTITKIDESYAKKAEQILLGLTNHSDAGISRRASWNLAEIYFSRRDIDKAKDLLLSMPAHKDIYTYLWVKAKIAFLEKRYREVIEIVDQIHVRYPNAYFGPSSFLGGSYRHLRMYDKLDVLFRREIESDNFSPWAKGNYAQFLLYRKKDIDAAISMANRALELMVYRHAQQTLAMAYYFKAVESRAENDRVAAKKYFNKAKAIGISKEYVYKHCSRYCQGIKDLYAIET